MKKDLVPQNILLMQEVAKYLPPNQEVPDFGSADMEFIQFVLLVELREVFDSQFEEKLEKIKNGEEEELRKKLARNLHKAFRFVNFISSSSLGSKMWSELDNKNKSLLEAEVRAGARFLLEDCRRISNNKT